MGIQMGRWDFDETEVLDLWVEKIRLALSRNSSQMPSVFSRGRFAVLHHDMHFVEADDSRNDLHTPGILWDGRLDNGPDLARELGLPQCPHGGDVAIVAAAYARWGVEAFREIIGDWALVVWNPKDRYLVLARDPIGLRPLFYSFTEHGLRWSNALDLLVQHPSCSLALDLEYLAGWLSLFPKTNSTPYSGIRAVPPSSCICFQPGRMTVHQYWDFDSSKSLRLQDDSEYEEQFRSHLATAVRRRLCSSRPLLAELSGGMDSSSIVCVADPLIARERGLTSRLDTISYYDDSEPNWNERPYFTAVEAKRGRTGYHIQIDAKEELQALFDHTGLAVMPAECGHNSVRSKALATLVGSGGYGAILSGIGGDEFLGGVPTAIPELADLLASFQFGALVPRLMSWAMAQRRPWIHLLLETLRAFVPPSLAGNAPSRPRPAWILPQFGRRYRDAFRGYDQPLMLTGARPSFQENLSTLEDIRRQIASLNVSAAAKCEKRFPYLDRDLLEFLFSIPRQQVIQPGRRRFLMRRSLAGIVPEEILTRKRKAYVTQGPCVALTSLWTNVVDLTTDMVSESLGILSSRAFRQALEDLRAGKGAAIVPVFRTLVLECWLRNVGDYGIVPGLMAMKKSKAFVTGTATALASRIHNQSSAG